MKTTQVGGYVLFKVDKVGTIYNTLSLSFLALNHGNEGCILALLAKMRVCRPPQATDITLQSNELDLDFDPEVGQRSLGRTTSTG